MAQQGLEPVLNVVLTLVRERRAEASRRLMDRLAKALAGRRLVVKVGSALLVEPGGTVRAAWLDGLARDVADLRERGQQVVIVTSGAIALGRGRLGLPPRALRLEEKQAAAAAGQIVLARAWQESLARVGLETAQLLITLDDTEARRRYLNARATIETLLRLGVVPVVNENDTVATSEIRFGDNDRLSARVAVMALADTLVLLSDIDGLYTADPRRDQDARHLPLVEAITPEIEAMAGGSGSAVGTGGMVSKLIAASIATSARVAPSSSPPASPTSRSAAVAAGARCTLFAPATSPRRARKHWIAASLGRGRQHPHRRRCAGRAQARLQPAARRASPRSRAASSAATPSWSGPRRHPRRQGPGRLRRRRRQGAARAPHGRDRGGARLSRPRRDGAPRRPGAAVDDRRYAHHLCGGLIRAEGFPADIWRTG